MLPLPKNYTLVAAAGEGNTPLTAFDQALLNAGVGNLNLLKVSSILPPGVRLADQLALSPGSLAPTAYGSISRRQAGERIAAAVAVGVPQADTYGVIMECCDTCTKEEIEARIRDMVHEAFRIRNLDLREVKVCAVEHVVEGCGCVFAGVVLW